MGENLDAERTGEVLKNCSAHSHSHSQGVYKTHQIVAEQEKPDPRFSTVKSPNPENAEALTLGIELAKKTGADIVITSTGAPEPVITRPTVALPTIERWRCRST